MRKIKICGFDFCVKYKPLVVNDGDSCLGLCRSDEVTIELKTGIEKQREHEVLLHESLHTISDIMNLELNENTINTLGVVLIDYIKKNKRFIKQIIGDK